MHKPWLFTLKVWAKYAVLSFCMAVIVQVIQHHVEPPCWEYVFTEDFFQFPDPDVFSIEPRRIVSRIVLNRYVMIDDMRIATRAQHNVVGRDWEISIRWKGGICSRRPYTTTVWKKDRPVIFTLFFASSGRMRLLFDFDTSDPSRCGLYLDRHDGRELLDACAESCREPSMEEEHTLLLRGQGSRVEALVDGIRCAVAGSVPAIEELFMEIVTEEHSCISIDDFVIRTMKPGGEWDTVLEERFDAVPFQTDRLDSRWDLNTFRSRITWVTCIAALLFDLVTLVLFGRRAPGEILLLNFTMQALIALAMQSVLFLPILPVLLGICAILASKIAIALLNPGGESLTPTSRVHLMRWLLLAALQSLHWIWFREVWPLKFHTVAIASLIPAILLVGLHLPGIVRSAPIRLGARICILVLLALCIESTMRSFPIEPRLDFDWRSHSGFWDLRRLTNLIEDHSGEPIFRDMDGNPFDKRKPEGVWRIVCLGSSSTYGISCNDRALPYPARLERILKRSSPGSFQVINAGIPGLKLTQIRAFFEDILSDAEIDLVTLYFGNNLDFLFYEEYYEKVEHMMRTFPGIEYPWEVEAALNLRWPTWPAIKTYNLLARSWLFMGTKLFIDSFRPGIHSDVVNLDTVPVDEEFLMESARRLVDSITRNGAALLLVPEILDESATNRYIPIFRELAHRDDRDQVFLLDFDGSEFYSHLCSNCHMDEEGYELLAHRLAEHLIASGLAGLSH
ncbi:SGNH/GDSL hydrolase family protein [Thermodesulfobacteriota bacterium]